VELLIYLGRIDRIGGLRLGSLRRRGLCLKPRELAVQLFYLLHQVAGQGLQVARSAPPAEPEDRDSRISLGIDVECASSVR
jgi:hypothetical protein